MRVREKPRTVASLVGERSDPPGWGPAARSRRPSAGRRPEGGRRPAGRLADGRALTVLRTTAYVLTSLASLVFLALVVYGALSLPRLHEVLDRLPGGAVAVTAPSGTAE